MRVIDPTARAIVNGLQGGFPLTERPFHSAGAELGLTEQELIKGVDDLVQAGLLSRFGPLWNAEMLGGAVCLAAMAVPDERFEEVVEKVNAFTEVAHNYERSHALNMWFVLATEKPERIREVIVEIEAATALPVFAMPKAHEFFVGFKVEV
jgi:DNA-binding Lrp family transcriptional regulator